MPFFKDSDTKTALDTASIARGEYQNSKDVAKLKQEMRRLEVINESLWLLLQKNCGCTHEDLNACIDAILLNRKENPVLGTIDCPNCGKKLQLQGDLKFHIACMYCGHKTTVNPYELAEKYLIEKSEDKEEEIKEPEYNIADDLNFDDLDGN